MSFGTLAANDLFTRFMAQFFDERDIISVSTAGQAFFGNPLAGGRTGFSDNAEVLDIDIIRGNERTAKLVPRGSISRPLGPLQKNVNDIRFSSIARKYPLSIEMDDITADQLLKRMAGNTPYQEVTKIDVLRMLAVIQMMENVRRHVRLFERLAWQVILTGKQDSVIGDTTSQYDFYRNSDNLIGVPIPWDNALGVPMTNIDGGCNIFRENAKTEPDMAIGGGQAITALLNNAQFKELADNRRLEFIRVSTNMPVPDRFARFVEGGMNARGLLRTPEGYELWLFSNINIYTDDAGDPARYMPTDKFVITSSQARFDRYFGPSEKMPPSASRVAWFADRFGLDLSNPVSIPNLEASSGVVVPAMFHHSAWENNEETRITIETQTAPIFVPTVTDAFVVLEDLITP